MFQNRSSSQKNSPIPSKRSKDSKDKPSERSATKEDPYSLGEGSNVRRKTIIAGTIMDDGVVRYDGDDI